VHMKQNEQKGNWKNSLWFFCEEHTKRLKFCSAVNFSSFSGRESYVEGNSLKTINMLIIWENSGNKLF